MCFGGGGGSEGWKEERRWRRVRLKWGRRKGGSEGREEESGVTSSVKTSESGVHGRGREGWRGGRKEGLKRSSRGTIECLLYVCSSTNEVRAREEGREKKTEETNDQKLTIENGQKQTNQKRRKKTEEKSEQ